MRGFKVMRGIMLLVPAFLVLIAATSVNAQTEEEKKSKLKIMRIENGDTTVTEETLDAGTRKKIIVMSEDDESGDTKVIIKKKSGDNDADEIEGLMDEAKASGKDVKKKTVTVKKDGDKTTVTTVTDGKEEVKVLQGKEAEEYLKKMKDDDHHGHDMDHHDGKKKMKKIIIEKSEKEESK